VGNPWELPAASSLTAELVTICRVANDDNRPTKLMTRLRDIRGLQFPYAVSDTFPRESGCHLCFISMILTGFSTLGSFSIGLHLVNPSAGPQHPNASWPDVEYTPLPDVKHAEG
jgi:hypothetical protein